MALDKNFYDHGGEFKRSPKTRVDFREATEYRIVKRWNSFFSHWYYTLEKKVVTRFLWWKFENWEKAGGNSLNTSIPWQWKEFCNNAPIIENP